MLVEKRRSVRHERLERYKRTGRVVTLVPDADVSSMENMRSSALETGEETSRPSIRKRYGPMLDGLLLLLEVGSVVGLIVLLFVGLGVLRSLNEESAQAQVLPTLTPTPLIVAVVLPSGHTPPNSTGGARPNEGEIPEHLKPLVQSLASVPVPTPGPEQASQVQIPAINVYAPVVQGDGWEQLKKGVAQHIGSATPGEKGNIVLTAHNDVFGEIFRYLDQLKPGDEIVVYTSQQTYTYIVSAIDIVEPTDVDVMAPTSNATITLISCYPYLVDNKRIVVKGVLQSEAR